MTESMRQERRRSRPRPIGEVILEMLSDLTRESQWRRQDEAFMPKRLSERRQE